MCILQVTIKIIKNYKTKYPDIWFYQYSDPILDIRFDYSASKIEYHIFPIKLLELDIFANSYLVSAIPTCLLQYHPGGHNTTFKIVVRGLLQ